MTPDRLMPLLLVLIPACSDSAGPAPGTFRAQLSGARSAALSGVAIAEVNYIEEHPAHHFVVRMHATNGDIVETIAFRCPGDAAPEPGTHPLSPSAETCLATYGRVRLEDDVHVVLAEAEAATGELSVEPAEGGQLPGTFRFSAPLEQDGETLTLRVSGSFSAEEY